MNKTLNKKRAEIFKALSNTARLDIIDLLLSGEKCVCEIQQKLKKYEQPHISKSLAKLKAVGLIKDRKESSNVYYSLNCTCIEDFFTCMDKIINLDTRTLT